jgi:pseudaminic acid synthase
MITIGNKILSHNSPCLIIGELSCNHQQDIEIAKKSIDLMAESGIECVKLQTSKPDGITIDCNNDYFVIKGGTLWDNRTLYDLYKETYTPWEWHQPLKEYAESKGLLFFSSPFDLEAVDFLDTLNVPAFKIASFEITDIPLIEKVASKGKPVIISTGIAEQSDINEAIAACKRKGNEQIIILKCTSAYPAPYNEMNLSLITRMITDYPYLIGLSDHTLDSVSAITAVALGAKIIEKHFIIDRKMGGPDAAFSMEPAEFKQMIQTIRNVEAILGKPDYSLSETSLKNKRFSRSLFIVKDVTKGEKITEDNVRSIRPCYGLHPKYYNEILGRKFKQDITKGTPLSFDLID